MECLVCQSTEFMQQDGSLFCKECNEKLEPSRTEQEGYCSKRFLLKSTAKKRRSRAKKNVYAPWICADGFNLLIYKQVSALISLGASEKLKTVVLYIWSKYLEKCEVAFRTDDRAKERVPRLCLFPRKRDIKVLYGDRCNKRIFKRKKKKLKQNQSKRKAENVEETNISDEFESAVSETKTSDSETESNASSDGSSRNKRSTRYNFSSHAQKLYYSLGKLRIKKIHNRLKETYVHHMTLPKTLSFCYLGLLYTEDQLLLCDLLRFVREDKIPYIDATYVFPPSMPLQADDDNTFRKIYVPTVKEISQTSYKLIEFLKLPNYKPHSLMPIVFRYVKDLNWPDSLIPIVNNLYNKLKRNDTVQQNYKETPRIPLYDVQAMALIIVALKLIFVLDGNFEIEHSKVMTKINMLLKGRKLFVWKDWMQQMYLKEFLFIKKGYKYTDNSQLDTLSADEIIRKYPMARLREFGEHTSRQKKCANTYKHVGRKEIKTLLENIRSPNDAVPHNKISSFLLQHELSRLNTEGNSWQMFEETKNMDFTFLNKTFSSDLIFYKRTEEISEESEELINLLLSSVYESTEVLTIKLSNCQNIIRTSSKYWYKNLVNVDFNMKQLWIKKLPASFVRLLQLLSKYMQVSPEDFYKEVTTFEKELSLCA